MPFDALFVPPALRRAVSDDAWLATMLEAERALRTAQAEAGVLPPGGVAGDALDVDALAREGRRAGNPVEPLARVLRDRDEHAHWGATSQDVLDTAAALVARDATQLILVELDGIGHACAEHVRAAAGVLLRVEHEHERAAGAWQAEWKALSDALAYTGGGAAWLRETLAGLEVDTERMRANLSEETMFEAERFAPDASRPEDYLGSAGALIDRALAYYRE